MHGTGVFFVVAVALHHGRVEAGGYSFRVEVVLSRCCQAQTKRSRPKFKSACGSLADRVDEGVAS